MFSNRKQGYGHHEEESNGKRMGREESGYKEVIFKEIGLNNIGNTCFMYTFYKLGILYYSV